MKTNALGAALLVLLSLGPASTQVALAQVPQRIQPSQVEAMFANMRARAPWNVDGPLLWGYFFLDPSRQKLQEAAQDLQAANYKVVSIAEVAGRGIYRLHVEKVETHSPASLNARNNEFYELATKHKLASYDGMDVGPVAR